MRNVPPPSEKIAGGFQQAGKKEGGLGEGIFARLLTAPKARQGWEAARPCVSKEAKSAKIVSLIEKEFCARPLKEKEIFTGFVSAFGGASRWGGFLPIRTEILAQKRFALRSVIAKKCSGLGEARPDKNRGGNSPHPDHSKNPHLEDFLNLFRIFSLFILFLFKFSFSQLGF